MLDVQQEEGLMSCLPLGLNQLEIQRGLTTSSTAIFVPFTTQELCQNGKEALYYGINAQMCIRDRDDAGHDALLYAGYVRKAWTAPGKDRGQHSQSSCDPSQRCV